MKSLKKKFSMITAIALCTAMLINPMTMVSYAGTTEPVNEALGKKVEASSVEAENAVDGNRVNDASRWGSYISSGPEWIYVDLGKETDVKCFCTFWESAKAAKYKIQIANTTTVPEEEDWETVAAFNEPPEPIRYNNNSVIDVVVLPDVKKARYVRLYIDCITEKDPMGLILDWPTISIYEFEVYGDIPSELLPL